MPGYPSPGNLANANGLSFPGPAALPGGVVYGQDAPIVREFLAAVSLNGGDAVILAPSLASLGYFVTKAAQTPGAGNNAQPIGVVTGARVGVSAASAASQPVWVVINGPAWVANQTSTIAAGNFIGLGSIAGQVTSNANSGGIVTRQYGATVSFATSITSTGGGVYYIDVNVPIAAPYSSLDVPVAFTPNASLPADLGVAALWASSSLSFGIRMFGTNVSTTITSQASIPGVLTTTQVSQPLYGQILGTALTSASASGIGILAFVNPA